MAKLSKVSFAGIDNRTDFNELRKIQKEFPMVEWGALCSLHWNENGNRYINPDRLKDGYGLNLCAHLCGSLARSAIKDRWGDFIKMYPNLFHRVQINIASESESHHILTMEPHRYSDFMFTEIIIQVKDAERARNLRIADYQPMPITYLIDASGGQGISSTWSIFKAPKVGYAGGLNPNNIIGRVEPLVESDEVEDFWIDMESGVRTDNWFDTDKVWSVLKQLQDNKLI